MLNLHALIATQVREHLQVSPEEFEYLCHPSPTHLHDPFNYKDMNLLVQHLRQFKKKQEMDDKLLLMVDGDYDTDGICASATLTAALSVFGFRFRVHVPSMADGYGLTKKAIDIMKATHETDGHKIGMILTADNGIAAFSGIAYAKELGIDVLVTDHHPSADKRPPALAVVDPKQPGDLYPFSGNSGACVAWKTMLAYADLYAKEEKPLIERLIVFAGLSNVADVMPLRNENRYTVVAALQIVNDLRSMLDYQAIADTPYVGYNTVFHGLYDLITLLEASKNEKRLRMEKTPTSLPVNEELFSWYLSPLLNAPRRVHSTCLEGLAVFLASDTPTRRLIATRLIALNEEKSVLRDNVLQALDKQNTPPVICVNTRSGISGLIAGQLASQSTLPSIVFSHYDPDNPSICYDEIPQTEYISASARSNVFYPLHKLLAKLNQMHPGIVSGGGHAAAAGFTIKAEHLSLFKTDVNKILPELYAETLQELKVIPVADNSITLVCLKGEPFHARYTRMEDGALVTIQEDINTETFAYDALTAHAFLESLRPFGEGFCEPTTIKLVFDDSIYEKKWTPGFWKSNGFKFELFGMEILTFNTPFADKVKETLEQGGQIEAIGNLQSNTFRGHTTPQLMLRG